MATQEEIIGGIRELEGEIRRLNTEIGGLENQQKLTPTDTSLAVQISDKTVLMTAIRNQITAKENRLTALITSQQGSATTQGYVYYLMKATIKNSKTRNGWRSGVYTMCAKALGYYNVDKAQSIYYEGDDLHINILFSGADNCHALLNALYETRNQYYVGAEIVCERTFQQIDLLAQPSVILASDYVTEDFDSPAFTDRISFDDSASICSLSNPTAYLLMLENPEWGYLVGLDVYDCHLMSVSQYPEEKSNPNNILRLSWSLHQRFDGLKTQGRHMVPQIAIGFVCAEKQEQIQVSPGYTEPKYRVKVSIESPDQRVLEAAGSMLKVGSESNPDTDGKLYSFVYVDSDTDFKRCLTVKYEETKALWERHSAGAEIPVEEMSHRKRGRS